MKFSASISPFEELDKETPEEHATHSILSAKRRHGRPSAELDMKAAADELEKVRETREEIARIHQDALFALQSAKSEEEQLRSEANAQQEITSSLKRELLSLVIPFGCKSLPDKNPGSMVENLAKRLAQWQAGAKRLDELERALSAESAKLSAAKNEQTSVRQKREELFSRVRTVEAERDSAKQQRVILFESRNPETERERMSSSVQSLRSQLNVRTEAKNQKAAALADIQSAVHALETEMAVGREDLQKHEIAFSKKMLALRFRNEDDYASALLTNSERRDLQNKLRELTQTDFDLHTEHQNTRAKMLELQAEGMSADSLALTEKLKALKAEIDSVNSGAVNDLESAAFREKLSQEIIPELKELILTCGLEEVF